MKKTISVLCLIVLTGCAMTPRQKGIGAAVVTIIAIGAIKTHNNDLAFPVTRSTLPAEPCRINPKSCI